MSLGIYRSECSILSSEAASIAHCRQSAQFAFTYCWIKGDWLLSSEAAPFMDCWQSARFSRTCRSIKRDRLFGHPRTLLSPERCKRGIQSPRWRRIIPLQIRSRLSDDARRG